MLARQLQHPVREIIYRTSGQTHGPITRLAGTLDDRARTQFAADLADVARQFNRADDGTVLAPGEYLEAVGMRR